MQSSAENVPSIETPAGLDDRAPVTPSTSCRGWSCTHTPGPSVGWLLLVLCAWIAGGWPIEPSLGCPSAEPVQKRQSRRKWPTASRRLATMLALLLLEPQLATVIAEEPFGDEVTEPKLYQVSFLAGPAPDGTEQRLQAVAAGGERVRVSGREIYTWHPDGVGRSRLAGALGARSAGVVATTRNFRTVCALAELAAG